MNSVFIIDTNVVVAGLLTNHADSPLARILDGMLHPSIRFALSEALLAEYRGVLLPPKLLRLHQLAKSEIYTISTILTRHPTVLPVPPQFNALVAPDVDDQFLWNLLNSREDLLLVTRDKLLLLQTGPLQARVMAPLEFARQVLG